MFFDSDRGREGLTVSAGDCVAGGAIAVHIADMRFVRKPRAVGPAGVFGRKWLDACSLLGMTNSATRFGSGFGVAALRRVANVAFGM